MKTPTPAALLLAGLAVGAAIPVAPALAQGPEITVSDAWARPTIPTRPGAGYLTLVNTGDEGDRLIAAEAERAEEVEIHAVREEQAVAKMARLEAVEVAAGETVVFAPGELHLMFTGLAEPLAEGDVFPATLVFEQAGEIEVEFKVGAQPPGSGDTPSD